MLYILTAFPKILATHVYIVETEEGGQHWKRHIDQLKDWLAPTKSHDQVSPPESESEPFFPNDIPTKPQSNSDTAKQIEHDSEETGTPETPEMTSADSFCSTAEDSSETVTWGYSAHNRQPPDFYL